MSDVLGKEHIEVKKQKTLRCSLPVVMVNVPSKCHF